MPRRRYIIQKGAGILEVCFQEGDEMVGKKSTLNKGPKYNGSFYMLVSQDPWRTNHIQIDVSN